MSQCDGKVELDESGAPRRDNMPLPTLAIAFVMAASYLVTPSRDTLKEANNLRPAATATHPLQVNFAPALAASAPKIQLR